MFIPPPAAFYLGQFGSFFSNTQYVDYLQYMCSLNVAQKKGNQSMLIVSCENDKHTLNNFTKGSAWKHDPCLV